MTRDNRGNPVRERVRQKEAFEFVLGSGTRAAGELMLHDFGRHVTLWEPSPCI